MQIQPQTSQILAPFGVQRGPFGPSLAEGAFGRGTRFTGADGGPAAYAWPSNLSPAGKKLEGLIAGRVKEIRKANPAMGDKLVPVELVTSSGGGLDPHISPAAALYQVPRIAAAAGLSEAEVTKIIKKHTEGRLLGIIGEPRVHVLKVNLELGGILK